MSEPGRKAIGPWEVVLRLGTLARKRRPGWPPAMAPARRVRSFVVKHRGAKTAAIHLLHLLDVRPRELDVAQAEVQRYADLEYPSLPPLVDIFQYKKQVAVVIERDDGVRLDRLKGYLDRDRERLPDAAVWFVGWRVCSALAQAHLARNRAGELAPILHGNLSLRDVLVGWDGDIKIHGLCPVLSDVPVAEGDEPSVPSRAWLAPSARKGEPLTPRVDTYAAALILRSLLTGRPPPTPGASLGSMADLREDIPGDVARSLDRALRGRARPSSAELSQRLEGLVRITDGRKALRDCMELYQALWGLWSVAAPDQWPADMPGKLDVQPVASFQPTSVVPSEAAPLSELDQTEASPDTSRSPGANSKVPSTEEREVTVASALESEPLAEHEEIDDELTSTDAIIDEGTIADAYDEAPEESAPVGPLTSTMVSEPDDEAIAAQRAVAVAEDAAVTVQVESAQAEVPSTIEAPPSAPATARLPAEEEPPGQDLDPGRVSGFRKTELGETLSRADEPSSDPAPSRPRPLAVGAAAVVDGEPKSRWPLYVVGGIVVGLMIWYSARGRRAPSPPAASASTVSTGAVTAPPPPTAAKTTAPPPAATAAPPAPTAVPPKPEPEPEVKPTLTQAERDVMEYTQGYLLVHSDIRDAKVFVNGHPVGPTGKKNKIFCGPKFVRLGRGNPPTTPWLSPGRTVELACRDLTVVSINRDP